MGDLFTLTEDIVSLGRTAFTDMINELGKNFVVHYPPILTPCSNCFYDSINKRSSNRYRPGGPEVFPDGAECPVCRGVGGNNTEVTEVMKLLPNYDIRTFVGISLEKYRINDGMMQTRGLLRNLPKMEKCQYLSGPLNTDGFVSQRYELLSGPVDISNIVQAEFFVCTWKVIGS